MGLMQHLRNRKNDNTSALFNFEEKPLVSSVQADTPESDKPAACAPVENAEKYGIQNVMDLMRDLPELDQEILVTIVKQTLESTNIKVSDIIVDGDYKESALDSQIKSLKKQILDYQKEIEKRSETVTKAEMLLEETSKVKELLKLAQRSQIKEKLNGTPAMAPVLKKHHHPPRISALPDKSNKSNPKTSL